MGRIYLILTRVWRSSDEIVDLYIDLFICLKARGKGITDYCPKIGGFYISEAKICYK